MDDALDPCRLEEDALYLGILTTRGLKPLSRLEYPVRDEVLDRLASLGLIVEPVTRFALNGAAVTHLILGRDPSLVARYAAEFGGTVLCGETPAVVIAEAQYFGYPSCCALAYVENRCAPSSLSREEQALLFHRACPGCTVTPALIPPYREALAEARRLFLPAPAA
jgi:hypothetical protein